MPIAHLIVGPNGAGKTTFYQRILGPATGLPFINADFIAAERWPGREEAKAYDAARIAEKMRTRAIARRSSFATETVFSHRSKLELVQDLKSRCYIVILHVVLVPEDLAVVRARLRGEQGGHTVPERKVRARYRRLWRLVRRALWVVDETIVYDNTRAKNAFRKVAHFRNGTPDDAPRWPKWSPLKWGR